METDFGLIVLMVIIAAVIYLAATLISKMFMSIFAFLSSVGILIATILFMLVATYDGAIAVYNISGVVVGFVLAIALFHRHLKIMAKRRIPREFND